MPRCATASDSLPPEQTTRRRRNFRGSHELGPRERDRSSHRCVSRLGYAIAQEYIDRGAQVVATVPGPGRTALHDLQDTAGGRLEATRQATKARVSFGSPGPLWNAGGLGGVLAHRRGRRRFSSRSLRIAQLAVAPQDLGHLVDLGGGQQVGFSQQSGLMVEPADPFQIATPVGLGRVRAVGRGAVVLHSTPNRPAIARMLFSASSALPNLAQGATRTGPPSSAIM